MKINVLPILSVGLENIFWNVFFESKNRGVSLERHFPWMVNGSDDVVFFEAKNCSGTVGGLVLRQKKYNIDEQEITVGMVGLVCVTPENRGIGIARQLLDKTILYAKYRSFDYLTLWTSQHWVYSRHKFHVADKWIYGWIQTDCCIGHGAYEKFNEHQLFLENTTLALPPFSTAVYEYSSDNCSFTLIEDREGIIVSSYQGSAIIVAPLMIRTLPKRWRLNSIKDDPLVQVLIDCGANINLSPVNLQMWLGLGKKKEHLDSIANKITIQVLDRV